MPKMDDQLEERFNRALRPVETDGVAERAYARQRHLARRRRVEVALLSVAVLAATIGGVALLTRAFGGDAVPAGPTRAPNGPLIVVTGSAVRDGSIQHLELIPTDGRAQRLTPDLDGSFSSLSASPDGRRIAFIFNYPNGGRVLRVLDLVSGAERNLAMGSVSGPTWSPDGTRVAYRFYGRTDGINVVPADLSGPAVPVKGTDMIAGDPSWSPDGTAIAFEGHDPEGGTSVMVIDLAGDEPQTLTHVPGSDHVPAGSVHVPADPVWASDGSEIDFAVAGGIWRVDAQGGEPSLLTGQTQEEWVASGAPPTPVFQSWSPDGQSLVYVSRSYQIPVSGAIKDQVVVNPLDGTQPSSIAPGEDVAWLSAIAGVSAAPPTPSPGDNPTRSAPTEGGVSSIRNTYDPTNGAA